jgi:hypothetical protein
VFDEYGEMTNFVTHFFIWNASNGAIHPAGGSRLEQPVKLLDAFTICKIITSRQEEKRLKKPGAK